MTRQELYNIIKNKRSFLCVGLDSDINKIPKFLLKEEAPVFEFNKRIIDATIDYTVAYKPNIAFYESRGVKGWQSLEKTIKYINSLDQKVFTIADAKRGDIGNTSKQYAKTFFDPESSGLDFDAVTVSPYMGSDSVKPFLEFKNKWVIILALTSNEGSYDFQYIQPQVPAALERFGIKVKRESRKKLFEQVMTKSLLWGCNEENTMFVIGATKVEMLAGVRLNFPNNFFLVPGVGAQGGSLQEVAEAGMNSKCGLLVNSSRGIIYASDKEDFDIKAGEKAKDLQMQMEKFLFYSKVL